jgi:hypothetical protein
LRRETFEVEIASSGQHTFICAPWNMVGLPNAALYAQFLCNCGIAWRLSYVHYLSVILLLVVLTFFSDCLCCILNET